MEKAVAICGIDGSGKTTQLRLLDEYLKERRLKVKNVWSRWPAFFSYPFLALCRVLGYTKWRTINRSNVRYAERRFYMNKALIKLWPWLFTIDTLIYSIFQIKIPTIFGYIILCDRFIPDIIVDLICETKDYQLPTRLTGRLLLSLIPKNSKLLLLDVKENTAYNRKKDIPSIKYLKERRKLYLTIAKTLRIPIIDGEKPTTSVHRTIRTFCI